MVRDLSIMPDTVEHHSGECVLSVFSFQSGQQLWEESVRLGCLQDVVRVRSSGGCVNCSCCYSLLRKLYEGGSLEVKSGGGKTAVAVLHTPVRRPFRDDWAGQIWSVRGREKGQSLCHTICQLTVISKDVNLGRTVNLLSEIQFVIAWPIFWNKIFKGVI